MDRFDNLKEVGKGNFATVFKALDKHSQEKVALKKIKKAGVQRSELEKEVDIMKSIKHQHLVNMIDFFETEREFVLVLDLVCGGELFERILTMEHYSEQDAICVAERLVGAVAYLHENFIVHRDIKPENILLVGHEDPITSIKIADFGLAAKFTPGKDFKALVGSEDYQAPEMLQGRGYNHLVDCYALGCVMYIILCGFPPDPNVIDFPEDSAWASVSKEAKDFCTILLEPDRHKRWEAKKALSHPWIGEHGHADGEKISIHNHKMNNLKRADSSRNIHEELTFLTATRRKSSKNLLNLGEVSNE